MINVENLNIVFGTGAYRVHAVRDVSFNVAEGESFGLVGESGSGKSVTSLTIMRLLAATAEVHEGKISFVGQDLVDDGIGGLVCGMSVAGKGGEVNKAPPRNVLTIDKARFVGDPVAVVIAETLAQAKDGAELVDVNYSELPSVVSTSGADKPGAPLLHEEVPDNLTLDWEFGDAAAVDAAFASAHQVTEIELVNNRMVTNPMEPRAAIGEYNSGTDETTLYFCLLYTSDAADE